MFGEDLDVTEVPEGGRSQARILREYLHLAHEIDMCGLQKVEQFLQKMKSFCKFKKNMFLPILCVNKSE